jgi:hypothetical protein
MLVSCQNKPTGIHHIVTVTVTGTKSYKNTRTGTGYAIEPHLL